MTLIEMLEKNTAEYPEKPAIIYKDQKISYGELNDHVTRLANSIRQLGVKKGDRIGLMLQREPHLVIAFLASIKAGAIPAPINYNLTKDQLRKFLPSLNPAIIFTCDKFHDLLREAGIKRNTTIVVTDNGNANGHKWDDLLKNRPLTDPQPVSLDDTAYLNYTSGSTGEQKGAMATHANIYWNTVSAVEAFKITGDDVHLCMFAPFAHPHELLARALCTGGTMVLLDDIFPKSLAEAIREHGVTCMMGLAPMYEMLLDTAASDDLKSLRIPESGGMVTRPDLISCFEKQFGIPIYPVWGSTETTGIAIAVRPGEKTKEYSLGKPCPYYEVKVVDENGDEVRAGEIGELAFRGRGVVREYYLGEGLIKDCSNQGWYFSGDLGRYDKEGFFYFMDRKSHLLKVAGLKVYPLEVEIALLTHPFIKEAAVIGVKDGLRGEIPKAVIIPKEGHSLTKEDIRSFCKGVLSNYKIPRIIELRDDLPRFANGKVNKRQLMEEARGGSV
ncbi:MAG: class I adenylate-forming enzyme family protein [Deltaproteobacteria bacterium]|nr:class I adenylate-forming enzyme family protein [Deltaproteobacteria bacterium]